MIGGSDYSARILGVHPVGRCHSGDVSQAEARGYWPFTRYSRYSEPSLAVAGSLHRPANHTASGDMCAGEQIKRPHIAKVLTMVLRNLAGMG
ncbi:hypothetical protein D9M70_292550 [compost metagenome]